MQSFATVLLAGCIACLAMIMMTPTEPVPVEERFALEITLEENGETFAAPRVVVEPGKSYVIDLTAGAEYDVAIAIPRDTRQVKDPFAHDLDDLDSSFLALNAEVSVDESESVMAVPDYGKLIAESLRLSLAEPAREFRSIIPVSDLALFTRAGQPIESLSISIKGTRFAG